METQALKTAPQNPQQVTPTQFDNPETHFDRYQFDGRPRKIRSMDGSPVEYLVNSRMHFQKRTAQRAQRWIPEWAMSDKNLRQVIARRATNWSLGPNGTVPETFPEIIKMCQEKLARLKAKKYTNPRRLETFTKHMDSITRCGGYLEFITKIAWLSLRAGYEAPVIADQMEISERNVRTQVLRLNESAERLGFILHVANHTKGRPHKLAQLLKKRAAEGYVKFDKPQMLYYDLQTHEFVEKCRSFKWTWREISDRMHVPIQGLMDAHKRFADTGYLEPNRPDKRKSTKVETWRLHIESRPRRLPLGPGEKQKRLKFVTPRLYPCVYTPELLAQARKLRAAGKTWKQVGKKLKHPWISYAVWSEDRRKVKNA